MLRWRNFQARTAQERERKDFNKEWLGFSRNAQTVSSSVTYWACNITFADDDDGSSRDRERDQAWNYLVMQSRVAVAAVNLEKVIILWARSAW